jgi:hypothetical protein
MDDALKFLHRGNVVTQEEAREYPVLALGLNDDNTVEAFASHEEFRGRAERTAHRNTVLQIERTISRESEHPDNFDDVAVDRHNAKVSKIVEDLNKLAERTGLAPGSEALFRRATTERPAHEPPIFSSAIAYDQFTSPELWGSCTGSWVPLWTSHPDLRRLSWGGTWNDRISCVLLAGALVLCENTLGLPRLHGLFTFRPRRPLSL